MTRCWVCNEEFGVDRVHICASTPFKIKPAKPEGRTDMKVTVDKATIEQAIDAMSDVVLDYQTTKRNERAFFEAQRALSAALAEPAEVPMLSDEEVGRLTVYGGLHHVNVPLLAEFVRHIESTIRRKAGL